MKRALGDMPLNVKGIVVVAIPVCALLASLLVFLQFEKEARTAQQWVDHTYQVRSELRQIAFVMASAEAAANGYLLTGDNGLVARYLAAREELPRHVAALRTLMRDNRPHLDRLREIEAQAEKTLQAFVPTGGETGASIRAGMDRLRLQMDALEADEGRLLEGRTATMNAAEGRLEAATIAGGVLGLVGGLISALIFTTRISRRIKRLGEDARRMARGEPIAEETGAKDEIAQLSHALKRTSDLLAAQNAELRSAHQELESRVRQRTQELVEANEQLRLVNEIRQAVVGSSPLAMWAVDLEGCVTFWNPSAERIFGWKEEEVLGRPLPVFREGQAEEFREWLEGIGRGESLAGVERQRSRKDGSLVDVLIWTVPLRDAAGRIHGALAIDSDITQQKVLEEQFRQAQKLEAVGRLAGGVAHDFNNLLTVIMGYVEMLIAEAGERPMLVGYAREIQHTADRASALTAQLLAFGRRQVSQPKVLDLNETVAHSLKMLHRVIGEDIQIDVHTAADLGRVRADPGHIEQVIMNLVVNARDAMPEGGRLTVETANAMLDEHYTGRHIGVHAGAYAMLAVSDTGMGMSPEILNRLFEPFFTTKETGKGTGLGLSIVYGIVKQAGGEIMVYSEEGRGTTFKVYLPLVEAAAETSAAEEGIGDFEGSETILLCEDEDRIRKLLETMLKRRGYRVLVAETPDMAIRIAREYEDKIDLLLTDVVMPQKNGFDLACDIRAIRPGIKLLVMSGYTDNRVSSNWAFDPGTPFLQKPFSAAGLTLKLREALGSPGAGV